jgi:hypothetical protein
VIKIINSLSEEAGFCPSYYELKQYCCKSKLSKTKRKDCYDCWYKAFEDNVVEIENNKYVEEKEMLRVIDFLYLRISYFFDKYRNGGK